MTNRELQIGMVGTFDVENYGDLLFPLIAEAELSQRLGPLRLHCFSYHQKAPPDWPFEVTSLSEFPRQAGNLDALFETTSRPDWVFTIPRAIGPD